MAGSEFYVKINRYCTDSYRSDEEYGYWSASYDFDVDESGAYLSDPHHSYELGSYVGDPLKVGETLYVIIASWSSGDSFGNSTGGEYSDIMCANRDHDIAKRNLEVLEKLESRSFDYKKADKLMYDNGELFSLGFPGWMGYFESLESLRIYTLTVKD